MTPSKLDFTDVNIGDSVTLTLEFKNKYGKDVTITNFSIIGSTDYIIDSGGQPPKVLAKNEILTLTIRYTPTSAGLSEAILAIDHDASTKPKEVKLMANAIPVARIELSESSYDFDKKLINKVHTHDFEIRNIGTADMVISNYSFTGSAASLYTITAGGTIPNTIVPGGKHTITVAFGPIVLGNFSADLNINHNAVNENSPYLVSLTGIGIDLNPEISLSVGNTWDFGSVATTIPGIQVCEIENTGTDPLTISGLSLLTGAEFTIEEIKDFNGNVVSLPDQVAVGEKMYVYVKFAPTAKTTYNDTLTIIHDGTNKPTPLDVPLSGLGRDELTQTFVYTGSAQQWNVPAGVTTLVVEAYGAEGGIGQRNYAVTEYPGKGGKVEATIVVAIGSVLNIYVGGEGKDANNSSSGGGTGGWNGGGNGSTYSTGGGGGGGGATDIRVGGTDLTDRILVAGAGGGSGCNHSTGDGGGQGGGLSGGNAVGTNLPNYKGYGGTQIAGGDLGGTLGKGGNGDVGNRTGGGGGGGYYGGGGSTWQGAGGGSSYTQSTATNVTHTQGVRAGNGEITFRY